MPTVGQDHSGFIGAPEVRRRQTLAMGAAESPERQWSEMSEAVGIEETINANKIIQFQTLKNESSFQALSGSSACSWEPA